MRPKEYEDRIEKVDYFLREFVSGITPPLLRNGCEHALFPGGKRVRAGITCLACEAVGGKTDWVIPTAASIELLHNATLVYDDIMSENNERRNKPSVYARYGKNLGLIIGETLHSGAFRAISSTNNIESIDNLRILSVLKAVADFSMDVCTGVAVQINRYFSTLENLKKSKADSNWDIREHITEKEYLDIISARTGLLAGTATKAGAIIGGGRSFEIEALWKYGLLVGTGYQVIDDILDIIGNKNNIGKPIGRDIKAGDLNFIIYHALGHADKNSLKQILSVWGNKQAAEQDIINVVQFLKDCGSVEYAKKKAESLIEQGLHELDNIQDSEQKSMMQKFTLDMGLKLGGVQ